MPNNADLGITIQKIICDKYGIELHPNAVSQFEANFNPTYVKKFSPTIDKVFKQIGHNPVKCLTYAPSDAARETLSPHNFILDDGTTLSVRTNKSGDKVAPRVVGQCGIDVFNAHFSEIAGKTISDKQEIKEIVFNKIDLMFTHFLDYLFISDYTVWIYDAGNSIYKYYIFNRNAIVDIAVERDNFSFTRDLENWNESTTLKYKGVSIAEIQIHKNRTFKFRFIMKALQKFIVEESHTNETFGITAEKVICDIFDIPVPSEYEGRWSLSLQREITPVIAEAFKHLPRAKDSTGATKGERGQNSKCSYDFVLEGDKTLSLKTNTGKMVCPPEVGQPGATTCYIYFGQFIGEGEFTDEIFKAMVLDKIDKLVPIYVEHLLDSDYLLWIYKRKTQYYYRIYDKDFAKNFHWDSSKFSFTKTNIEEWNESNTLKYDGVSIGEFQVHKARSCFKFRFNLENFDKVISEKK